MIPALILLPLIFALTYAALWWAVTPRPRPVIAAAPPPVPVTINGASGIAVARREREYATQLWLDNPLAFWLHPEGPLSDLTPDEWRAKQPKPAPVDEAISAINAKFQAQGLLYGSYAQQSAMLQLQNYQWQSQLAAQQLHAGQQRANSYGSLSSLIGGNLW